MITCYDYIDDRPFLLLQSVRGRIDKNMSDTSVTWFYHYLVTFVTFTAYQPFLTYLGYNKKDNEKYMMSVVVIDNEDFQITSIFRFLKTSTEI